MQKILNIICSLSLSTTITTSVIACSEEYLTITMQDQDNEELLKDIAFDFMYKLPKAQQPHLDKNDFSCSSWFWNLKDDFTLRGTIVGYVKNPPDMQHQWEYWTIDLRKTTSKNLFVWNWQENNNDSSL